MPCTLDSADHTNNLISFDARYVLNGTFGGSVSLTNQDWQYNVPCEGACTPISITIDNTLTEGCCPDILGECFETAAPEWIAGVVVSTEETFEMVDTMNLSVVSYYTHLADKPIYTQQFPYELLSNVITIVSEFYGGIPTALTDYTIIDTYIRGPVQGGSFMDELRLLAQAGMAHLFVQVGGILTIEPWKDQDEPSELTITQDLVFSITHAPYSAPNVNLIRVRGASVPTTNCGEQPFTDARITDSSGGVESIPGYATKTAISGVPTPKLKTNFENLAASQIDLKNAKYLSDEISLDGTENIEDGSVDALFRKSDGSYFGASPLTYSFMFYGNRRDKAEYAYADQNLPILAGQRQQDANTYTNFFRTSMGTRFPVPWGTFGNSWGSPYAGSSNPAFANDQPSYSNLEITVTNPDISLCGTRSEEISNKYVLSKEKLFALAVRRFQEMKLEANTWNIEVPYLPCLRLNQVITVEIPKRYGLTDREVTGVIAGLDIVHEAEGTETTMRITLWDLSCLGQDEYSSDNLIQTGCAGDNALDGNPYVLSALGMDSHSGIDGGMGWLFTYLAATAQIELTHTEMSVGDTYTISFDYETYGGPNTFAFTGPPIGGVLSGSGSFSESFVSAANFMVFDWSMIGNATATTILLKNIRLTKTVLA